MFSALSRSFRHNLTVPEPNPSLAANRPLSRESSVPAPAVPRVLSTRDRLIASARFLFWERGFAGTSMAELLAHAQVNSGSFYHFFDSKEALLREVLEGYLHLLRPMVVDPAFAAVREPVERIFAIL